VDDGVEVGVIIVVDVAGDAVEERRVLGICRYGEAQQGRVGRPEERGEGVVLISGGQGRQPPGHGCQRHLWSRV